MKLDDLSDLIVFDGFPLTYIPKQKIILTHLLHLERQTLPQKLCTICTTQILAKKFKKYCEMIDYKGLTTDNFCYLEPYNFIDIVIEKRTLQIFTCESQNADHNLMILIRENGKLNYVYAGNFVDTRTALLDDDFAKWISQGVEKLYVNLKHVPDDQLYKPIQEFHLITQSLKMIEDIITYHEKQTFAIYLPLFGYDNFVQKLSNHLPRRVALLSNLSEFYSYSQKKADDFCKKPDSARIYITGGAISKQKAKINFEKHGIISLNISADSMPSSLTVDLSKENFYYDLCYSPEPDIYDLQLLILLCKPKRIYGIIDRFNVKSKPPQHLIQISKGIANKRIEVTKMPQQQQQQQGARAKNKSDFPIIVGSIVNNRDQQSRQRGPFLNESEADMDD
uniref:Uncharacterized protein n=1 Tax=Glossina brevipalpis TaxID=37001 RepID=A0A1A9W295_9MUSC